NALQLGFEEQKEKNATLPERKRLEKLGLKPMKVFREFRFEGDEAPFSVGDEVKVDVFQEGDRVRLTGWSKGKGFQGVVKRHGFGGGPKTHGQSDRHRAPGSLGQSSYPSRVFKGLRMAGRMGGDRVTVKNRRIVRVLAEQNMLMVEGVVPGARNGLVLISN
ncbi:MAG: 50S ribosomal protein L3, partial [Calditrichaeota bacterium]